MTDDLLMGIPVSYPTKDQQLRIAQLLDLTEQRLMAAQQEYDLLVAARAGFMQQLFI